MDKKAGDIRSEIRALRAELRPRDYYPNYGDLSYGNSRDDGSHYRTERRPQTRRLHRPQRYRSRSEVRRIRQRAIRQRQRRLLLATVGLCVSGLLITRFWPNGGGSIRPQPQIGIDETQRRSLTDAQTAISTPVDVAKLESLDNIPAPPEKIVQAVQFYLDAGLTPTAVAYLVGSLSWESGLDPQAVGDAGQSKGLNQWWVNRRRGLPDDFEGQLAYVLHDMQQDRLSLGTLTTLQTSSDRTEIKAALKRWTRWQEEGDRWDYAETILVAMTHDPASADF
ncbi:MAG: phage tail tip lysozyme [Leptolyngbyaceae cyanobacterium]